MATSSESGQQLFSRLGGRRSAVGLDTTIFPEDFPKACDVYELYGDEGCGKTELLFHLVVRSIVPSEWNGIKLNGLGIGVVYIDTDYKFCMLRLSSLLESFIRKSVTNGDNPEQSEVESSIETIVKASLKNFWLVRCSSSEQLVITICSLDSFIGSKFEIGILLLDSVSSFYWTDKLKFGDNRKMVEKIHGRLVAALEKLVNTHNLVLFATKSAIIRKRVETPGSISPVSPSSDFVQSRSTDHYELLSNQWTKFVKFRWILAKSYQDSRSSEETGLHTLTFTDKVNVLGSLHYKILQNGIDFSMKR